MRKKRGIKMERKWTDVTYNDCNNTDSLIYLLLVCCMRCAFVRTILNALCWCHFSVLSLLCASFFHYNFVWCVFNERVERTFVTNALPLNIGNSLCVFISSVMVCIGFLHHLCFAERDRDRDPKKKSPTFTIHILTTLFSSSCEPFVMHARGIFEKWRVREYKNES